MPRPTLPALHPAGIAVGALLTGAGVFLAEIFLGPVLSRSVTSQEGAILASVHQKLTHDFVRPVEPEWLMQRGVAAMVEALEDPYTFYVGPESLARMEEESSGRLIGVGLLMGGPVPHVRWPFPGGPAEAAGLRPGDRILAVDGVPVDDLPLNEVARRIKGPEGTRVRLRWQPLEGPPREAELLRKAVPTGTVVKVRMLDPEAGIGALHIASFAATTTQELDQALAGLREQGLRALVLDLRFNAGGLLPAAVGVASRFLPAGVVCTLRDRHQSRILRARPGRCADADLPVVLLVNRHSASGSEVLAGALRDHGAAVLVGRRTFGKGVFQQVHHYPSGHFAFKMTAGYYQTPGGRILEGHLAPDRAGGLLPDVPVPVTREQEAALAGWLESPDPPDRYRQVVARLFPEIVDRPPPEDPDLEAALELLHSALGRR